QAGDEIISINNKKIKNKSDLDDILDNSDGNEINVVVNRNGEEITFNIKPTEEQYNYTGIAVSATGTSTEIAAIYPNSPAEKQGLQVKDLIVAVNDVNVENNT